jgi:hypothetical protein
MTSLKFHNIALFISRIRQRKQFKFRADILSVFQKAQIQVKAAYFLAGISLIVLPFAMHPVCQTKQRRTVRWLTNFKSSGRKKAWHNCGLSLLLWVRTEKSSQPIFEPSTSRILGYSVSATVLVMIQRSCYSKMEHKKRSPCHRAIGSQPLAGSPFHQPAFMLIPAPSSPSA